MWKTNKSRMHGLSDIGPNVPAFLIKLWKLVNDRETDELICWSEMGMSFVINKPAQFAKELLPLYYKHNNMASFIRQLNMYGFHKVVTEVGGIKNDKDYMEFAHQFFIKDHPYLLENIKRKMPNPKPGVISNEQLSNTNMKSGTQSEILARILSDVNNLKGKQESWEARLASMKRENEALWRELAIFRQKHLKQEQIINRLIHFIVTIVQPSRNVPLRRRYPLMLSDVQPVKKITKLSGADTTKISQGSSTGPTIHEIDTTDVLFENLEQPDVSSSDAEYVSSDFNETSSKFEKTMKSEISGTQSKGNGLENVENIPEDWLEIHMTEGDLIDPLTPIDPAKVNPAVAAATLKHLEGTNKISSPIAITVSSVPASPESGKKNVTEKKVIYLTDINSSQKPSKKNSKKPIVLKMDISNKKSSDSDSGDLSSSPTDLLLNLVTEKAETSNKPITAATAKRKLSSSSDRTSSKKLKKADSKSCVPDIEIGDLGFLLTAKQTDDVVESRESEKSNKTSSTDPFLKLNSLYNGTIDEDQLTPSKSPLGEEDISKKDISDVDVDENKLSPTTLMNSGNCSYEGETEKQDDLNFEPESLAVVCQQSGNTESIARDFGTHVESIQEEIDYLKEMLKGEGYNFDPNSLPWLFNDDPLSYGVLPVADEENKEKKNEEIGNELMTYGAPNLMDLVDLMNSPSSNQDWSNVLSPTSPIVTDVTTPAPSPSR